MSSIQSLEFYQRQIARQSQRIQVLQSAIAALRNQPTSITPPRGQVIASLSLAESESISQRNEIKTLLGEIADLRSSSDTGKRKLVSINPQAEVRGMPPRESEEYLAEALYPCIIYDNPAEKLQELLGRGREALHLKDYSSAHTYFSMAISYDCNDHRAYLEKASIYFLEEDYSRALDYCEGGLGCAPSDHDLLYLKDEILEKMDTRLSWEVESL